MTLKVHLACASTSTNTGGSMINKYPVVFTRLWGLHGTEMKMLLDCLHPRQARFGFWAFSDVTIINRQEAFFTANRHQSH